MGRSTPARHRGARDAEVAVSVPRNRNTVPYGRLAAASARWRGLIESDGFAARATQRPGHERVPGMQLPRGTTSLICGQLMTSPAGACRIPVPPAEAATMSKIGSEVLAPFGEGLCRQRLLADPQVIAHLPGSRGRSADVIGHC